MGCGRKPLYTRCASSREQVTIHMNFMYSVFKKKRKRFSKKKNICKGSDLISIEAHLLYLQSATTLTSLSHTYTHCHTTTTVHILYLIIINIINYILIRVRYNCQQIKK